MKKILILLSILCYGAYADTINLHWLNEDGSIYENSTCTVDGDLELPTPPTKYGYTFTGWDLLPYVPLEYIESTGTQWIDSGVTLSNRLVVETVFQTTSVGRQSLFGDSKYYRFYFDITNYNFRLARGNAYIEFRSADTNKHTLRFASDTTTVMWDGNPITVIGDFAGTSTDTTVKIFAVSPINPDILGHVKYYSFKMYKNDELLRDFIPVLDGNGTPCMYDKVEGKFYYNQGTGQFIAGPVLQ